MCDGCASMVMDSNGKKSFDYGAPSVFLKVDVGEGASQTTFSVHKNAFFHYCTVYGDIPGQEEEITDVEADTFSIFLHWMYTQNIERPGHEKPDLTERAKLFVFAKKYGVDDLAELIKEGMLNPIDDHAMMEDLHDFASFFEYVNEVNSEDVTQIAVSKLIGAQLSGKITYIDVALGELLDPGLYSVIRNLLQKHQELLTEGKR